MRCVIMAGGRGERLRPLTDTCPKPLLPVAGRPVLDRLLEKLAEAGLVDVTLAVGYLGAMIEDYVGDGARWGVHIDYVRQTQPMGTAGALSLLPRFKGCVLVANGDKIVENALDIKRLCEYEWRAPAVATTGYLLDFGIVREGGWIAERPEIDRVAGFYWLPPYVTCHAQPVMDMPELLRPFHLENVKFVGYVLDIGTPATYEAAHARLSAR